MWNIRHFSKDVKYIYVRSTNNKLILDLIRGRKLSLFGPRAIMSRLLPADKIFIYKKNRNENLLFIY